MFPHDHKIQTSLSMLNSPVWKLGTYFILMSSAWHSKDFKYLEFLNIIRKQWPIKGEYNTICENALSSSPMCYFPSMMPLPSYASITSTLNYTIISWDPTYFINASSIPCMFSPMSQPSKNSEDIDMTLTLVRWRPHQGNVWYTNY